VHRQLRRRTSRPDIGSEVDGELEGGLPRFGKGLRRDDASDADVELLEIREGDHPFPAAASAPGYRAPG
jgi:hypothetical protein